MNLLALRYKKFHSSHVLGWCAVGLLIGIGLSQILLVQASLIVVISLWASLVTSLISRRWWAVIFGSISCLAIGIVQGSAWRIEIAQYATYHGQDMTVEGRVAEDPKLTPQKQTQFLIDDVKVGSRSMPGSVFVSLGADAPALRRGDRIILGGKLSEGFGSYQASLRNADTLSVQKGDDPMLDLRDTFGEKVRQFVSEPAASLGLGFVVGQRSEMPEELDEQMRIVGLTHIVVASGYNLTILIRLARRLFENHSKYLAFASSMGLMILFVAVSGLTPSMVRAAAVTGLSLLAWYYGRRFHPVLIILYVAAVTAFINPIYLWSDIGWYLSFLAFAGVLLLAPLVSAAIERLLKSSPSAFIKVIIETISAQLLTLPLILFVFGVLPVLSVVSNALVAPIIPLAMLLTFLTGVLGFFLEPLAAFIGGMATIAIDYVLAVVAVLSGPDWAQQDMPVSAWMMVGLFVAVIVMILLAYRRLRFDYRSTSVVE